MKNKKWISLAAAVVLAVTALQAGVFAAKMDGTEEKLTKVTLNEVAIRFSMRRSMWQSKKDILKKKVWILHW